MGIDLNAIRQENSRLESQGQSNFIDNFVMMPEGEGTITIRLLPPQGNSKIPYVVSRTHKLNGKTFHSPLNLVNGKWVGNCPINNYYRSLWKKSESASEAEAKMLQAEARQIKPVERYYWNAIVRIMTNKNGDFEYNVGPKIFSCGKQLQAKIIRAMCGAPEFSEPELGDVTDLLEGRDLKIIKRLVKSGDDKYPNYNESKFLNVSPCGTQAQIDQWMANLHDLESLRIVKSYEELDREVRIHRGLEKDPELASFEETTEVKRPVPKTTVAVNSPVDVPKARTITPPDEDFDESVPENDFFKKLKQNIAEE